MPTFPLDELALVVAFSSAYFFKLGNLEFINSPSWRRLLAFLMLTNPYSGIFRRRCREDIRIQLVLVLESFLTACAFFYLLKMGEDFSREMVVVMYSGYASLALLLKYLHKRRLLSRWSNRPQDSIKRIVLVCSSQDAEESEQRLYADDMKASRVVGFCFTDSPAVDVVLQRPAAKRAFYLLQDITGYANALPVATIANISLLLRLRRIVPFAIADRQYPAQVVRYRPIRDRGR
ncbi:hypothetical protein [Adlercreutzia equolifaciens]|uniref:hypothetical protein n=1 Tax=Adlercreutzia equolifaciens TaxID=446660 RepID=UPI003AF0B71A